MARLRATKLPKNRKKFKKPLGFKRSTPILPAKQKTKTIKKKGKPIAPGRVRRTRKAK